MCKNNHKERRITGKAKEEKRNKMWKGKNDAGGKKKGGRGTRGRQGKRNWSRTRRRDLKEET